METRNFGQEPKAPLLAHFNTEKERRDAWLREHRLYLARDYAGLNLESLGVAAARRYYAPALDKPVADPQVTFHLRATVTPLTEHRPYVEVLLEVTRHVPPGRARGNSGGAPSGEPSAW